MKFLLLFVSSMSFAGITQMKSDVTEHFNELKPEANRAVVVMWASWCGSCKEKMTGILPKINEDKKVAVIAVNNDRQEERAQDYIDKNGIKLPVVRDTEKKLTKELKSFSVPHWAVYKKENSAWKLVETQGGFDEEKVLNLIKQ